MNIIILYFTPYFQTEKFYDNIYHQVWGTLKITHSFKDLPKKLLVDKEYYNINEFCDFKITDSDT
jgi:hypothetical protein